MRLNVSACLLVFAAIAAKLYSADVSAVLRTLDTLVQRIGQ